MGFLDKAKAAAEQAAAKAKEGVEDVQTKRELWQAYQELGKATFEQIESGAITDVNLQAYAERIRAAKARSEAGEAGDEEPVTAAAASDGGLPETPG